MKKVYLLVISILLMLSFCACTMVQENFKFSQQHDNVKVIEIYNSEKLYDEGNISSFKKENEPIAILETDALSDCLNSIEQLKFEEEKVFFPIPMDGGYQYQGYILIIVYTNGGYDLIASNGQYSYAIGKDGQGKHTYKHADYCGELEWDEFVEKFLET